MSLVKIRKDIESCTLCPRLREHCLHIAEVKRRAYREQTYWGKPVPGFGDPKARLLVLGLAPGAHGANRTGRVFTGDRSGDFLYRAMYETGFANQPTSVAREDGLQLHDAWVSASVRCAPPDNKPLPEEFRRCRPFLDRELAALRNLAVVVCLGKLAWDTYLGYLRDSGKPIRMADYVFGHGAVYAMDRSPALIGSYHPSQQNTSTGRLTAAMLHEVFATARGLLRG
ncbi:uracil-DNA glycosylase [Bryobacterales bacterium F-183]|nr:uracil-DNA glycosylase [Bryobacterales bacterium F-183]